MSRTGPIRLAVALLMLALAGLSACGQMGPLQLPDSGEPVATENGDDEDRDADER